MYIDRHKKEHIGAYIPPPLAKQLRDEAAREHRTVTDQIIHIVAEFFAAKTENLKPKTEN
jgi:hypothetical protein